MRKLNKGIRYVMVILFLILLALFLQYQHKQTKELQLAISKVNQQIEHLQLKDHMNDNRDAYMYMILKDMGKATTTVKEVPVMDQVKVREEVITANPTTYNEPFTAFIIGTFFSATTFVKNLVGVH